MLSFRAAIGKIVCATLRSCKKGNASSTTGSDNTFEGLACNDPGVPSYTVASLRGLALTLSFVRLDCTRKDASVSFLKTVAALELRRRQLEVNWEMVVA